MTTRAEQTPIVVLALAHHVLAVDVRTGKHVWERDIGGGEHPRIAVTEARVYVLGTALWCFDLATGKVQWRAPIDGETMLLGHGTLVIGCESGEVIAVDAETGRTLWQEGLEGKGMHAVALAMPGVAMQIDRE